MPRGKAHNSDLKAKAQGALLSGRTPAEVARRYGLAESTVRSWAGGLGEKFAEVRAKKGVDFDEAVGDYLTASLTSLTAQARHARDPAWLMEQPAHKLALLHGVMFDKAIRVLELSEASQRAK